MTWEGDRLVVRGRGAASQHATIELNGVPLRGARSLSLSMSADELTTVTLVLEVTPDIDVDVERLITLEADHA